MNNNLIVGLLIIFFFFSVNNLKKRGMVSNSKLCSFDALMRSYFYFLCTFFNNGEKLGNNW